jgi:CheY-like chemotaxis protein
MDEREIGSARQETSRTPLILLVDDFDDHREGYAEYFRAEAFRVLEARDGGEALARAFDEVPDVVVMDLGLPGMDGWEATRRLKADPRTRRVPVVALTGHAGAVYARAAVEAGCDSFVVKPCRPQRLLDEVRRLIARAAPPGPATRVLDERRPAAPRTGK